MSKPIPPAIYALRAWTIKEHAGKYYISPTAVLDDKKRWSKSYATLQRACTAIARKLAEEWTERNQRRNAAYRVKEGV